MPFVIWNLLLQLLELALLYFLSDQDWTVKTQPADSVKVIKSSLLSSKMAVFEYS